MNWGIAKKLALMLSLSAAFVTGPASAQSIFGFKIGDDLRVVGKGRPNPSHSDPLDSYVASKWHLPGGNDVSVTVVPATGRIVYMESDWGGDPASAATDIPGLQFGTTTLADIRKKFRSNGFTFKQTLGQVSGDKLVFYNCYEVGKDPDLIAVFITTLPISDVPIVDGEPKVDSSKARLDAVILANLAYLKEIWGEDRIFDPAHRPIAWN